jgi:hypothetical protein
MTTVENLRKSGWKVRVLHYRSDESCEGKIKSSHSKERRVNPKGGKTVVILDSPTGDHFEGLAICSSEDLYNKKIGVKIAIGRALFSNDKDDIGVSNFSYLRLQRFVYAIAADRRLKEEINHGSRSS